METNEIKKLCREYYYSVTASFAKLCQESVSTFLAFANKQRIKNANEQRIENSEEVDYILNSLLNTLSQLAFMAAKGFSKITLLLDKQEEIEIKALLKDVFDKAIDEAIIDAKTFRKQAEEDFEKEGKAQEDVLKKHGFEEVSKEQKERALHRITTKIGTKD